MYDLTFVCRNDLSSFRRQRTGRDGDTCRVHYRSRRSGCSECPRLDYKSGHGRCYQDQKQRKRHCGRCADYAVPILHESEIIRHLNDTLCDNASHLIFRSASYAVQKRCRRLEKMMSRIAPTVPTNTGTKVAATLSQVKASLDKVTNVHCV
jgi:hypothetical protein